MKRMRYIVALSVLAALLLGMIAIVPASAEAPFQDKETFEYDFIYGDCGFDVPSHMVMNFHQIYYFNRFGDPRSDSYHVVGSMATLTYNNHTLFMHNSQNTRIEWITFYDAIYQITGIMWIGAVPGHGVVTGTMGRQTVLESCNYDEEMNWVCEYTPLHLSGIAFSDQEAVCEYLLTGK